MKTKEIEVWVCEGWQNYAYPEFTLKPNGKDSEFTVKAKLIIELPEKKITISESDIDKAFSAIRYKEEFQEYGEPMLCAFTVRHLSEKLFSKADV